MSQYISLDDPLIDLRQAHRDVITGTLSKLSLYRSSLSLSHSHSRPPQYIRQKVSLRVRKEEDLAMTTHELSLHHNYSKLKHNLKAYARCKSMKLNKVFERQTIHVGAAGPVREDLGRLSTKSDKDDRTVFIDRKYNREFAISSAMAVEMTAIADEKVRMRRLLSEKTVSPLARQTKQQTEEISF